MKREKLTGIGKEKARGRPSDYFGGGKRTSPHKSVRKRAFRPTQESFSWIGEKEDQDVLPSPGWAEDEDRETIQRHSLAGQARTTGLPTVHSNIGLQTVSFRVQTYCPLLSTHCYVNVTAILRQTCSRGGGGGAFKRWSDKATLLPAPFHKALVTL